MAEPAFTERELDIMSILWRLGPATVAQVREELSDDLAYTSVLSALQTLEEKGYVDHEAEGRAYRYRPLVAADAAGGTALTRLLDKIFHGSAEQLLAQLVTERQIAPEELKRMRKLLLDRMKEAE
ncbi:MAG: BlaI/MecI/CopY family transcriptional regulator [Longimicrobiales bacterium]